MLLDNGEDAIIERIIREQGLSEENCLNGLTEQQRKVWVRYAILGESVDDIMADIFSKRKYVTQSVVQYVLDEARLRIIANLLHDADIIYEAQKRGRMIHKIRALLDRVRELRKKKGAKRPCRG